jgi:hypothetical protein
MKYLKILLLSIFFLSCKKRISENENRKPNNKIINDTVLINSKIVAYYKKEFEKTKSDEPQTKFKIINNKKRY